MSLIKNGVAVADQLAGKMPVPLQRLFSNAAAGWCLCDNAVCRRAQSCQGEPRHCLRVCGLLLSEQVWSGALAYVQGKVNGQSFDAVMADWPEQIEALGEWVNRAERGRRAPNAAPATSLPPAAQHRRRPTPARA